MRRRFAPVLVLVFALALVAAACGNDNGGGTTGATGATSSTGSPSETNDLLGEIMSRGTVTVATDPKYPPQSKLDVATNTWEGFDIDVANEIAKRMGVKVEYTVPPWNTITAGKWQDRWQLSVGSMTITEERQRVLDFTPPYYYTPAALAVYKTNTSITGPADLTGKTVGVCQACTYEQYLEGTLKMVGAPPFTFQIKGANVKTYDTDTTAIQDLSKGDCISLCAVLSALPTLQAAIDAGQPIKIIGDPQYYEPLAVAIDKEAPLDPTSLLAKVSDIVDQMHADGTLATFSCKWYHVDLTVTDPSQAKTC
jgi:polar amino acid transport system substrate-binding protein